MLKKKQQNNQIFSIFNNIEYVAQSIKTVQSDSTH